MRKNYIFLFLFVFFLFIEVANAQITAIPDPNFEQALIDLNIDSDGVVNGQVLTSDVSELVSLDIRSKGISDLTGIEDFVNLRRLYCHSNSLASVDVSKNLKLERLYVHYNLLTSLDVTSNINLTNLLCFSNRLSLLDVSSNQILSQLYCNDNNLNCLTVSQTQMEAYLSNSLPSWKLDRKTGVNLDCNSDDDNDGIINNMDLCAGTINGVSVNEYGCHVEDGYTFIPDYEFILALRNLSFDNNLNFNIDIGNRKALTQDISSLKSLDLSSKGVFSLTGIESFTALESLNVENNRILEIDVTNCPNLTYLNLGTNKLSEIDVSNNLVLDTLNIRSNRTLSQIDLTKNTNLTYLNLGVNKLSEIDLTNNTNLSYLNVERNELGVLDVSNNLQLNEIYCNNNKLSTLNLDDNSALTNLNFSTNNLTSINLNNNIDLTTLYCDNNSLNTINLNNNRALKYLDCSYNNLSSLIVDNNRALKYLDCSYNNLSSLIVDNNTDLTDLRCYFNNLEELRVDNNAGLSILGCIGNNLSNLNLNNNVVLTFFSGSSNNLSSLSVKNGFNSLIEGFSAHDNPNLECIQVDDAAYSTANWYIDDHTSFSEDCSDVWEVYIPDTNLETSIVSNYINVIDTSGDGKITYEEAAAYTGILDLSNQGITDVTGLQAFTNVTEINLSGNSITDLSILFENDVVILSKTVGEFKSASLATPSGLEVLDCSFNSLISLDVSAVNTLTTLNCSNNQLEYLNVKNGNNTILTNFDATNNQLNCINVDNETDANSGIGSYSGWNKDSGATYSQSCSTLGIEDNEFSKSISVYPNPTNKVLYIKSSLPVDAIELYNILGKRVLKSSQTKELKVDQLQEGLYFLKLISEKAFTTKKIMIK